MVCQKLAWTHFTNHSISITKGMGPNTDKDRGYAKTSKHITIATFGRQGMEFAILICT
jgi:hypothetical protein